MSLISALQLLLAVACALRMADAGPSSYVVQVSQQLGTAPYTRGLANQLLRIWLGTGPSQTTSFDSVDTGSGLMQMPCSTPSSRSKNCSSLAGQYILNTSHLPSLATCTTAANSTNGTACFVPSSPSSSNGSCYWVQQLEGGHTPGSKIQFGYYMYSGIYGVDTITLPDTIGAPPVSLPNGLFGCSDSQTECAANDTTCLSLDSGCVPSSIDGGCPGTNFAPSGKNAGWAGWNFNPNTFPNQLYKAGMIDKVVGMCYLPPAKNFNCAAAANASKSYVVLGSGSYPTAIKDRSQMQSVPLLGASESGQPSSSNSSADQFTIKFESRPLHVTVPRWGSSKPAKILMNKSAIILWDSGAASQSSVTPLVFNAAWDYFQKSLPTAKKKAKKYGFEIVSCGNLSTAQSICGQHIDGENNAASPMACNMIKLNLKGQSDTGCDHKGHGKKNPTYKAATSLLLSLHPKDLGITLEGGALANLPVPQIVNLCNGNDYTATEGVAVCNYLQNTSFFWLANPWFVNRFIQFDLTAPDARSPGSIGTMYFSGEIDDCSFSQAPEPSPKPSPQSSPQPSPNPSRTGAFAVKVTPEPNTKYPAPYLRGLGNQLLRVTVGTGSGSATYSNMVDTGSGLLDMPCSTPGTRKQNCSSSGLYYLDSAHLTSQATCNAAAASTNSSMGCFTPLSESSDRGSCYWVQELTGGNGFNIYSGVYGQDTVSLPDTVGGSPLTLPQTLFGCYENYNFCAENNTVCREQMAGCVPSPGNSTCPGTQGLEAGWNFSPNSLPNQLYKAGVIDKAVGVCYRPPAQNARCDAVTDSTSYVVLGTGKFPKSLPNGLTGLHSAPLVPSTFPPWAAGSTQQVTTEFRSIPTSVTLPLFGSDKSTSLPVSGTILWDTGAYTQSTVPGSVYNATLDYFNAALPVAQKKAENAKLKIVPCGGMSASGSICGNIFDTVNGAPGPMACNMIALDSPTEATRQTATEVLLSLHPSSLNITLQGGAVAALPVPQIVSLCGGSKNNVTQGVAVCNYLQPDTQGADNFWLANPWFVNRFTLFDLTAASPLYPNSTGTIYFSDPLTDCSF